MGCTTARLSFAALPPFLLACAGIDAPTTPAGHTGPSQTVQAALEPPVVVQSANLTNGFVFQFHDCVGPAGTPQSFTAVKTELPAPPPPAFAVATAYRLTDGSAIFLALIRGDRHHPPGIDQSSAATTSCLVDTPIGTLLYRGFLAPVP